eukprot:5547275-Prymnesium_polylepis.1
MSIAVENLSSASLVQTEALKSAGASMPPVSYVSGIGSDTGRGCNAKITMSQQQPSTSPRDPPPSVGSAGADAASCSMTEADSGMLSAELRADLGLGFQSSDWKSALALATACVWLSHLYRRMQAGSSRRLELRRKHA